MTLPPRRKHIRHDQGEGHLHELTFSCFRFWQEGPGFDRNLFGPEAITASMDYIHLNPVKRGLCEKATDWKWSSARFYLGETTLPGRDNSTWERQLYLGETTDPDLPTLTRPDAAWFDTSGIQKEHG